MQRSPAIDGIMSSADWVFDDDELAAAFNEKTKAIILNTPSNPLGKVYSRDELMKISDLCKKYDVLCISDEVYEWLIFDDNEHVRICEFFFYFSNSIFVEYYKAWIDNRFSAWYVGTHNHDWIGWQSIFNHWMEDGMGLRTRRLDLQPPNGSSKFALHVPNANSSKYKYSRDTFIPRINCDWSYLYW